MNESKEHSICTTMIKFSCEKWNATDEKERSKQNWKQFSSPPSPFIVLHMKWTYLTDYQIFSFSPDTFSVWLVAFGHCQYLYSHFVSRKRNKRKKDRTNERTNKRQTDGWERIQWHRECVCYIIPNYAIKITVRSYSDSPKCFKYITKVLLRKTQEACIEKKKTEQINFRK